MTKTTCFITGASRGFGRFAAISLAEKFGKDLENVVLFGRDLLELEETRRLVTSESPSSRVLISPALDLANLDDIENVFSSAVGMIRKSEVVDGGVSSSSDESETPRHRLILINNAGNGNPVANVKDLKDLSSIRSAIDLNVTSCIWVTSVFLRLVVEQEKNCKEAIIVNVSSLAALQPFASMGIYSIGKAARDMLHRVVAEEHKDGGESCVVKTLNYAPGPMDTKLQDEMRSSPSMNGSIKSFFNEMAEKNTWVKIDDSAKKLATLLFENTFSSGEHIDYYDIK